MDENPNVGENKDELQNNNAKCAVFWDFENCV